VYTRRRLSDFELHKPYRRRARMRWSEEVGKHMVDLGGILWSTRRISDSSDV
jgi:hypothetical protein